MGPIKYVLAALAISAMFAPGSAIAAENRAVKVSIFGIGPAVDGEAYKQVRQVFGEGVASGTLDKFVVYNYGIEGGFSACAELGKFLPSSELRGVLDKLNEIKPNPSTTSYAVQAVGVCE